MRTGQTINHDSKWSELDQIPTDLSNDGHRAAHKAFNNDMGLPEYNADLVVLRSIRFLWLRRATGIELALQ